MDPDMSLDHIIRLQKGKKKNTVARGIGRGGQVGQVNMNVGGGFQRGRGGRGRGRGSNRGRGGRGRGRGGQVQMMYADRGQGQQQQVQQRTMKRGGAFSGGISPLNRKALSLVRAARGRQRGQMMRRGGGFQSQRGQMMRRGGGFQSQGIQQRPFNQPQRPVNQPQRPVNQPQRQRLSNNKRRLWGSTMSLNGSLQRTITCNKGRPEVEVFLNDGGFRDRPPVKKLKLNRNFGNYGTAANVYQEEVRRKLPSGRTDLPKVVVHQSVSTKPTQTATTYDDTGLSDVERRRLRELKPAKRQKFVFDKIDFSHSTTSKKLTDRFSSDDSASMSSSRPTGKSNQNRGRGRGGRGRGQGSNRGRGRGRGRGGQSGDAGRTVFF